MHTSYLTGHQWIGLCSKNDCFRMLVISLCSNVFESSSINNSKQFCPDEVLNIKFWFILNCYTWKHFLLIELVSWLGSRPEADGWAVVVGICWEARFEFPLRLWPFVWKTLLGIEFVAVVDEDEGDEDDDDDDDATADTTVDDIMLVVGGCNIVAPAVAFSIS